MVTDQDIERPKRPRDKGTKGRDQRTRGPRDQDIKEDQGTKRPEGPRDQKDQGIRGPREDYRRPRDQGTGADEGDQGTNGPKD